MKEPHLEYCLQGAYNSRACVIMCLGGISGQKTRDVYGKMFDQLKSFSF